MGHVTGCRWGLSKLPPVQGSTIQSQQQQLLFSKSMKQRGISTRWPPSCQASHSTERVLWWLCKLMLIKHATRKRKRPFIIHSWCTGWKCAEAAPLATRELPELNQAATPVVCKLTPAWTGATDTSPPGEPLTSQGRYVINPRLKYQRFFTAAQDDLKRLLSHLCLVEGVGKIKGTGVLLKPEWSYWPNPETAKVMCVKDTFPDWLQVPSHS